MKKRLAGILAGTLLSIPTAAQANGRYPASNQFMVHPRNPDIILVRATFGLMLSKDHGQSFHWICEQLFKISGNVDPGVALFGDGSYAIGGLPGLAVSHDDGCSFPFIGGSLKDQYVIDLAVDGSDPRRGVAITATDRPSSSRHVQVFETNDNGTTWTATSAPLDPGYIVTTIDVAPSDPNVLYVGGGVVSTSGRRGIVIRSNDRGRTWSAPTFSDPNAIVFYVSGVDPTDPDRVFVRQLMADPQKGDKLLISHDGFKTFDVVPVEFTASITGTSMTGFAVSPDGTAVAIGGLADGVYIGARPSSGNDYRFHRTSMTPVNCLKYADGVLYGCGYANQEGITSFVIGKSHDDGATWTPMVKTLQNIAGPLPVNHCASDSPYAATCPAAWEQQRCMFVKFGDPCIDVRTGDAGQADPGSPPSGSSGGGDSGCGILPRTAPKAAMGIAAFVLTVALIARRVRAGRRAA
ncbi:WD40/YVTN/BNR-like repeat-containing protein [Pendulispora albinea]|uniref:Exo-alpha-sialidase n=1 Tax=Pendulispora albinea TaxID=2741071 RepID=A0ABZ2LN55_9BACT